ncbi:MAG: response regulator transcription factor [Anaerolineaceae bacterium]|nr:response regulator transcription factor [Anaerolineaceae bacterium]
MPRPEALPIPKARILVVDDEPTTRRAVARALGLSGYEAEAAASGAQALELLAARPYDLMLLDLRMPGMDGVEVMARVQERHPNLLIIVFTAHATVHSAVEAVRAGAVDYLLKPSTIHDIEAAVARALERQRERLRRQHLIQVMAEALAALQAEDALKSGASHLAGERFLRSGPISFDRVKRLVVVAGSEGIDGEEEGRSLDAELTEYESVLLAFLMERPDRPFSCRQLARALGYDVDEREAQDIVRPHISRLRKKVEFDPGRPRWVRTLRGQGYLFSTAPAP